MRRTLGFLFILVGLLILGFGATIAWDRVYEPRSWPRVKATVVDTAIVQSGHETYSAQLTFAYSRDGDVRERALVSSPSSSSRQAAEEVVAKFPKGSTGWIHVKPGLSGRVSYQTVWTSDTIILVSLVTTMAVIFMGVGFAGTRQR